MGELREVEEEKVDLHSFIGPNDDDIRDQSLNKLVWSKQLDRKFKIVLTEFTFFNICTRQRNKYSGIELICDKRTYN